MTEHERKILEEENIFKANMNEEEKIKVLNILKECNEIKNTIFPVGNCHIGDIIKLFLHKENNIIKFNGDVNYSDNNLSENRCIEGVIYLDKDITIVDMHIIRLCVKQNKSYTIIDKFKENKHEYIYNYDLEKYEIERERQI